MKKILCLLIVIFIFTGFYGCEKDDGSSPTDNTDTTDISDLSYMESSEITSSDMTSSTVASEAADNSEILSEDNQESCVSSPDDGRIEELEEENARLNASLSAADNEIETLKKQINDLEQQLDESGSQYDNTLVEVISMNYGARLYLYGSIYGYRKLNIVHADKFVQTIFSDSYMTTIEPSPYGSKVVMNDFEPEGDGSDVFLYDVNTRETRELLMPDLPVNYAATFMGWLDDRYFLFVSQFDHGTVAVGGDIYVYDTETDNYRLLIANEDKYYQICSFNVYYEDLIILKAIKYDEQFSYTKDVYYSVTVNDIYNLINSNKTMTLKEENEIYSPTFETNVNIAYASEQTLKQFRSYDEFTDDGGSECIIFFTYAPIKDFCFISVAWDENEENPFEISNPTPQDILYSTEQLKPDKPLVIKNTYIREITGFYRGIKFTDENNTVRYFYIYDSGKDGLTLVEFTSEVN